MKVGEELTVYVTNHLFRRLIERQINGLYSIKQLNNLEYWLLDLRNLNSKLKNGEDFKVYNPILNGLVPVTYDHDINKFVGKTFINSVSMSNYKQSIKINWVYDPEVTKYLPE